jgi:hypothetical protein
LLDDGYSPARTGEQIHRLADDDQAAFVFDALGTSTILPSHRIEVQIYPKYMLKGNPGAKLDHFQPDCAG